MRSEKENEREAGHNDIKNIAVGCLLATKDARTHLVMRAVRCMHDKDNGRSKETKRLCNPGPEAAGSGGKT